MDITKIKKQVTQSCVGLIKNKQFYGHIVSQLEKIFSTNCGIQTMGVGRLRGETLIKMFVNPNFVKKIMDELEPKQAFIKTTAIIEHEVLHVVFGHPFMDFQDEKRGSVAVDLCVNSYIKRARVFYDGEYAEDYDLPSYKSADWYYKKLANNPKFKEKAKNPNLVEELGHKLWRNLKKDPAVKKQAEDIVQRANNTCLKAGKNYGNIPRELVTELENVFKKKKPIIPWKNVLRMFTSQSSSSYMKSTMKKTSKRYGTRPAPKIYSKLSIAVVLDTSASMSDEDVLEAQNEINFAYKNGAEVYVYECDAGVEREYRFKGKFDGKVHGRGGTNMQPAIEKAHKNKYDCCIIFTDGYVPTIKKRINIPQLWVLNCDIGKKDYPYKFDNASYIKINTGKAKRG